MTKDSKFLGSKKGNLGDVAYLISGIFGICLVVILSFLFYTKYNEQWQTLDIDQESKDVVSTFGTYYSVMQTAIILFIVGLTLALCISAFLMPSTPALVFLNIIGIVILTIISGIYSYVFNQAITSNVDLTNAALSYAVLTYIMSYLHYFCVGVAVLVTIAAYAKYKLYDYG